jgi:hypothetical protein
MSFPRTAPWIQRLLRAERRQKLQLFPQLHQTKMTQPVPAIGHSGDHKEPGPPSIGDDESRLAGGLVLTTESGARLTARIFEITFRTSRHHYPGVILDLTGGMTAGLGRRLSRQHQSLRQCSFTPSSEAPTSHLLSIVRILSVDSPLSPVLMS